MATKKGRKISGGKYIKRRKKKLNERPGQKRIVKTGEEKKKTQRTMGGNKKTFLLKAQFVNISGKKNAPLGVYPKGTRLQSTKLKGKKVKIKNVLETPSNRFLARQNILTKGTIVETELGKVKITNRPTQEAVLNGVLVE